MHTISPPAKHTQHSQIDEPTWLTARRFRLIAADGQSRVFAVDSASANADTGQAAADGQYGQWVRALARVALANLEEALDHEADELRRAAERDGERIAESRRIQACTLHLSPFHLGTNIKFYFPHDPHPSPAALLAHHW
jgi:hypothetical protein